MCSNGLLLNKTHCISFFKISEKQFIKHMIEKKAML